MAAGAACFELRKKLDEEIAREAQAYHTLRKKNRGRRKPVTLGEPLKGLWEQLHTIEWRVAHTRAVIPGGLLLMGGSGSGDLNPFTD